MTMTLRILHWLSRCILAAIFLYSGYVKVQAPLQFASAISGYKLFPENFVFPIATYFPWVEIALGLLLLSGWKIRYVSLAATGLLLFFTAMLTITYFRGIEANCGCFSFNDRISLKTIARDSLFLIPALFLVVETRLRKRPKDA
jgi:uncharacterized membrane protein YphA (DoxX/SURF4 family)